MDSSAKAFIRGTLCSIYAENALCSSIYKVLLTNYCPVLDTEIIPDAWLTDIIKPVFKTKGDTNDLDNYRALCFTSNMGKVFTSFLNTRHNKLSDEIGIISESQGGFRKGYSVQDNMFVLHSIITLYLSSGKKLFCAFYGF